MFLDYLLMGEAKIIFLFSFNCLTNYLIISNISSRDLKREALLFLNESNDVNRPDLEMFAIICDQRQSLRYSLITIHVPSSACNHSDFHRLGWIEAWDMFEVTEMTFRCSFVFEVVFFSVWLHMSLWRLSQDQFMLSLLSWGSVLEDRYFSRALVLATCVSVHSILLCALHESLAWEFSVCSHNLSDLQLKVNPFVFLLPFKREREREREKDKDKERLKIK